jgi:hypothetical protein
MSEGGAVRRLSRLVAVAILIGGPALAAAPASAGPATWTTITSPTGPGQPIYQLYNLTTGHPSGLLDLSGTASSDVTAVNIYCFYDLDQQAFVPALNTAPIPVSAGAFSAADLVPPGGVPCVLRAIPTSYTELAVDGQNTGYVGAFAGPTLYSDSERLGYSSDTTVDDWAVTDEQQRAQDFLASPDLGGVVLQDPARSFSLSVSPDEAGSILGLTGANRVQTGLSSSRSEIVIDGHNAYLPLTLSGFVADPTSVPAVQVSVHRHKTGNVSIVETDPLTWCSGDAYPQSAGSCTPVPTGVALSRRISTSDQGAVITVADRFVSTDHVAHSLKLEYNNLLPAQAFGHIGVRLPGKSTFFEPKPNTTKSHLRAGAHTIVIANDLHAAERSLNRVDTGLTYSAKPIVYFASRHTFGLQYSRQIPAGGFAGFAFRLEVANSLTAMTPLAQAAQRALTDHLVISAPHHGATVTSPVTVKGSITKAVNGLPTTVRVHSAARHKTATVSASGRWTAKLTLAAGTHRITVKTTDPGGVKLSTSVVVKVKP